MVLTIRFWFKVYHRFIVIYSLMYKHWLRPSTLFYL